MTASDHLKHRTGSLGGDQIPEEFEEAYANCLKRQKDPGIFEYPWGTLCRAIERLAQKTREYEDIRTANGEFGAQAVSDGQRIADLEAALAQKTRECEEAMRSFMTAKMAQRAAEDQNKILWAERGSQKSAFEQENIALRAQLEQLGRQVAEMTAVLNEVKEEECSCDMGLEAYTPCASCKATQLLLASRARTK